MLEVIVSKQIVAAKSLSYSNVDPGGFEIASFLVTQPPYEILAGDDVLIMDGLTVAWKGRVEEPGRHFANNVLSYQVNAVGYGAELREDPFSLIYVDSDMSTWAGPPTALRIVELASNFQPSDASVDVSPTLGLPSLRTFIEGSWVSPSIPMCLGVWDAGFGNKINEAFIDWTISANVGTIINGVQWHYEWYFADTEDGVNIGALQAPTGTSGTIDFTGPGRFLIVRMYYNHTPDGADGKVYDIFATNMSLFGPHGLTIRTDGTRRGLYVSDIVGDIIARGSRFAARVEPNTFLATQVSYKETTDAETMIDDMRKLTGWHWGVWEPNSILDELPSFWFTAPPAKATASVYVSDCEDIDVTESYSSYHNEVVVKYNDSLGKSSYVTTTRPSSRIRNNRSHVLVISMGVSTAQAASAFAEYVLDLDQSSARAAGSCRLPTKLSDGRPSHLVKAGRDKIKIVDFPSSGPRAVDTITTDVFHVKRVSVQVENGLPSTQIEFDQGADLIEVLQSRLVQGNTSIGF